MPLLWVFMARYSVNFTSLLFPGSVITMTVPNVIAENIVTVFVLCQVLHWLMHMLRFYQRNYKRCHQFFCEKWETRRQCGVFQALLLFGCCWGCLLSGLEIHFTVPWADMKSPIRQPGVTTLQTAYANSFYTFTGSDTACLEKSFVHEPLLCYWQQLL